METNTMGDFVVASNGHCFFCLNQIVELKQGLNLASPPSKQINSLQFLTRYLRMDLKKVFMDREQVSPALLAKVDKARLKVELCHECRCLSEIFSNVYRKLEKLELELGATLRLILGKLKNADAKNKLKGLSNAASPIWNGLFDLVEILREEAIQKTSSKLPVSPQVKIKNLSEREISAKQSRHERKSKNNSKHSQRSASRGSDSGGVIPESLNDESLSDNDNGNYFFDHDDSNLTTQTTKDDMETREQKIRSDANVEDNMITTKTVSSAAQNIRWAEKCSVNPETGKRKCNICYLEFHNHDRFRYHYHTVHLKLRYKCVFCNKLFSLKSNLTLHQRTSGSCSAEKSAPKFKCHLCEKSFNLKQPLQTHLDGVHFKILKYGCNICEKKFMTKVALFTHRLVALAR